jgi:hypothetical protein
MNRPVRRTIVVAISALALLVPAGAARAATGAPADKLTVLSSWTQTTAASTNTWLAARTNQAAWATYQFDWTTDYCSDSPDQPLGYDFTLSCAHHDFGYRNYKAVGLFAANKDRLDTMLYNDLQRKCATYTSVLRPPCLSLAWSYYQAVHLFGSFTAVPAKDIQRARQMQSQASASAS